MLPRAKRARRHASPEPGPITNEVKPKQCAEPCSSCGAVDALYSKRMMQRPARERQCLACKPCRQPTRDDMEPITNEVKPQISEDPCAGCGLLGMEFSKRQMAQEPRLRRCLQCMQDDRQKREQGDKLKRVPVNFVEPSRLPPVARYPVSGPMSFTSAPRPMRERAISSGGAFQPRAGFGAFQPRAGFAPPPPPPGSADRGRGRSATPAEMPASIDTLDYGIDGVIADHTLETSIDGVIADHTHEAGIDGEIANHTFDTGTDGVITNEPKATYSNEPCSRCRQTGMMFSKRQMHKDASKRVCLVCLPVRLVSRQPVSNELKPNISHDPCSMCGDSGVVFSNRQMQLPVEERLCVNCMKARHDQIKFERSEAARQDDEGLPDEGLPDEGLPDEGLPEEGQEMHLEEMQSEEMQLEEMQLEE